MRDRYEQVLLKNPFQERAFNAVYEGYSKVGYVKRSYSGRWDIYEGYSKVGYIAPGAGRWQAYQGYSRVGSIRGGTGGPAAAAALLLLVG